MSSRGDILRPPFPSWNERARGEWETLEIMFESESFRVVESDTDQRRSIVQMESFVSLFLALPLYFFFFPFFLCFFAVAFGLDEKKREETKDKKNQVEINRLYS